MRNGNKSFTWNCIPENDAINWYPDEERAESFCLLDNSRSILSEHRVVTLRPGKDPENDRPNTSFPNNRIATNKYTLWNFLPKNLFEQFRRIANFYFLVTAIVAVSIESPISPLTSSLPLSFVILVTACKQGYEDYLRHRLDRRVNRTLVTVIRIKCAQEIRCEEIVVGDIVKVSRDQDVPCDLVLLYSAEDSGRCFVTTSNLDGETNLKTLRVPKVVSTLSPAEIVSTNATITCQQPLADLYTFHGKLEIDNENGTTNSSGCLTTDNLLLRGAKLRDTEYAIGCAVYTGQHTKLSLNSKITSNKFSTAEKSINRYLVVYIIILLIEMFASTALKLVTESSPHRDSYLGERGPINFSSVITDLLSFMILYNYIVPISLYVTVELQKFLGSFFFARDIDMYDAASDQPAVTNSSDLNEELGQIEYLFADKTGTLTENHMVFKRCSIDGKVYTEKDCDGKLYLLPPSGDETEAVQLTTWQSEIWHFMISISLCHVVQIAPPSQRANIVAKRTEYRESFRLNRVTRVNSSLLMSPDLPEYQAASSDEKALVEASARCGVVFQRDSNNEIEIKTEQAALTFDKLDVLEFSSDRKRMSVIVKDAAGDLWLYCKGADSTVLPLIVQGKIGEAIAHVADFAMRGLRTLVVGYKRMEQAEYERLIRNVEQARQVVSTERSVYVNRAYDLMESGLTLLGVTAVEDRLQEGVQETLESLRAAGIKVWVLTGDKVETAENVAFLCGHFKRGTRVLKLTEQANGQACFLALTSFERRVKLEPYGQYGLITDGVSMATAIRICPELLRSVGMSCEAVVSCRLTPLQKGEIVHLIKRARRRPVTAALGDGGNDVSMIQEAHVGIGILGKEGRQAANSADFAIAKFMHLKKALLVHGHWYYLRISILTQYFFYKNLVFVTPQLLFGIHNGFSAQGLYDSMFLMCFNMIFTSLPVLMFGLLEQDHSAAKLLKEPHLYKLHERNYLLSSCQFAAWTITGVWHTCAIYFITYLHVYVNPVGLHDGTPIDQWSFGTCVFHAVTLVANIQILTRSSYWTWPFVLSVLLSELVFFGYAYCYSLANAQYDGDMLSVFPQLLVSPSFWILTVVIVVACLALDLLIITYNAYRPQRVLRKNENDPRDATDNCEIHSVGSTPSQKLRLISIFPWRGSFSLRKTE